MSEDKFIMFQNRLVKVYRHLGRQARKAAISCYRLYDHDLPEFPLCIEIYGEKIYIAEYRRRHGMTEEEHDAWMEKTLNVIVEVLNISRDNIFLKLRQRKPGRLGQYQKQGGEQREFIVEENGLKFLVNLSDYLDTGLFLDHRITRQMVREQSEGKKVLNLFAYTGSFSVYAAAGGAMEVETVDLSKTYLSWAERNFSINNLVGSGKYIFTHADVLQYLKNIRKAFFDIIILDPPTFSNSKRMDEFLDVQMKHVEMINQCLEGLAPGGILYFSTNLRTFKMDTAAINASQVKDITQATRSFDFEGRFTRFCYSIRK